MCVCGCVDVCVLGGGLSMDVCVCLKATSRIKNRRMKYNFGT